MKWIRFTLDTHTDAVDMLSYMLDEIGVEGIEIEDHLPLSEEDKKKMFVDILPDPEDNDGTAKVHFYMEPENCDPEKVMIQVQNIFRKSSLSVKSEKEPFLFRKPKTKTGLITGKHFSNRSVLPTISSSSQPGKNIKKKKIPIFLSKSTLALLLAPVPTKQRNFVFRHLINM